MMLWSEGSLSPSVIFSRTVAVAFLSLLVSLAPAARFFRPGGIMNGGRGLSESGSTLGPSCISFGVPLNAGEGSLRSSGTNWPELEALSLLGLSSAWPQEMEISNSPQISKKGSHSALGAEIGRWFVFIFRSCFLYEDR